ncbi:EamA family transporter [Chloroflexota bacterium]
MTPLAIFLVTTSALIHALWNLLGKRQNPSAAFFLIASFFATLVVLPILYLYRSSLSLLPHSLWGLLAFTGVFQTIYYLGLTGAYRHGDISTAYPLLRAVPVILVTLLSIQWNIGKPLNPLGVAGIVLIVLGCLILPLPSLRGVQLKAYLNPCCLLALLAALGTTGYTMIDNQALAIMSGLPQFPTGNATLLFVALQTAVTTLILAFYTIIIPSERAQVKGTWNNGWSKAALAGFLITGTYGLVLLAMNYANNVSYIAAFRQLSIPLAAMLGFIVQKEPATQPKLVGIALVFSGLIIIGVA